MKVVYNFLQDFVASKVKEQFGNEYIAKGTQILKTFEKYPYPKKVGYWFVHDNDLYLVVNES